MRSKTVLLAAPYFLPQGGGLERYVANLAGRLHRDHGWRVVIACSGAAGDRPAVERLDDYVVYRLPAEVTVSNTPLGLSWRRNLQQIMARESVDLVNAHAPVPGMADVVATVAPELPFVLTYHAGPMKKGRLPADLAIWAYEKLLIKNVARRADHVVCSSGFVQDCFDKVFQGKSSVIAPGVDAEVFAPTERVPGDDRVLFVVSGLGRSASHKGLDDLLQAVAELYPTRPALRLEIAVANPGRFGLDERCRELGIAGRVDVLGALDGHGLADAYRRARVVALPTYNESVPTVLLEAMACAVPVVAYAVGGVPALVEHGSNGLLANRGDVPGLTRRLAEILDDRDLAEQLGRAGRKTVEDGYLWSQKAEETNRVFEAAMARRRPANRRVAIVAPYFPPRTGGLERYAHQVASAVRDAPGLEPIVITTNHEGRRARRDDVDGIPVIRLGGAVRLSNTPVNPLWIWRLYRLLRRERVDVINAHAPVPYLADLAVLAAGGRPVVMTYHAGSMAKGRRWVDLVIRGYERFLLPRLFRRARLLVSVSPKSLAHGQPNAIEVSPGVDTAAFVPDRQAAGEPVVLFVGRIANSSHWKGIPTLLRAFADILVDHPRAVLALAGAGDAIDQHRLEAEALGIGRQVRFLGELKGRALIGAYQRASVVVLPSMTESESFGMCLIEAMACGRPVVGSRIGGIPSVIEDGRTGLLVPPGDHRALAAACSRLLADPELADAFGEAGRARVLDRYSYMRQAASYVEVFRSLALRPGSGRAGSRVLQGG